MLSQAKRSRISILVMGAGSNILAKDDCIDALVLRMRSGEFAKVKFGKERVYAGSAALLNRLARLSCAQGLGGLEFLAGIPGTLGGALVSNAGAWGRCIGDLVKDIRVMDSSGKIKTLTASDLKFGYRRSNLSKYIVLSATLKLSAADPKEIERNIAGYLKERCASQDLSPSAGCVFKNPAGRSAGALIDECGLKGKKSGGARISEKHANFIVNTGNASARDVINLMSKAFEAVKRKFRINLEPEIKIWQ